MQLRNVLTGALVLGALAAMAGAAEAYPRFQFTTDNNRCAECHISPAGGGLLNEYGRSESADTISMGDSESFLGDPRPFNGLFEAPDWFLYGMDYRGAMVIKDASNQEPELLGFPMQADLYTHFDFGDISWNMTVGIRGAARDNTRPPVAERFVSREHYAMWRPSDTGAYARAGRFFPVFGLRVVDHTSVIRRRLGFHVLEEPYAISGGIVNGDQEVHGAIYTGSPLFAAGRRATGASIYYERRIREGTGAIGGQAKVDMTGEDVRVLAGGVGKLWFPSTKLLLLGELDLGTQKFRTSGKPAVHLAAHTSLTHVTKPWLMTTITLERYDNDLRLARTARDSATLSVQFFPRAHWELMLLGRLNAVGDDYADPSAMTMFMLHYYL